VPPLNSFVNFTPPHPPYFPFGTIGTVPRSYDIFRAYEEMEGKTNKNKSIKIEIEISN
jgi:hypothetical protein